MVCVPTRARVCVAAALLLCGCGDRGEVPVEAHPDAESIFGAQLHVHGSMSEGPGSMRGHNSAARALGGAVDVIWWSDHDWRIGGHTYVNGFGFEDGLKEIESAPAPLRTGIRDDLEAASAGGDPVSESAPSLGERVEIVEKVWRLKDSTPGASAESSEREARSGSRSLHLVVDGGAKQTERVVLAFEATRRRHIASLASDVRLGLSVLPVTLRGDARLVLSVRLSNQPPDLRGRLDYVLTPETLGATTTQARAGRVEARSGGRALQLAQIEVPAEPGLWNDWVFDLTADARAHSLGGEDNSMAEIVLLAEVRGEGRLDVHVDDLRIERSVLGEPLFHRERLIADGLSAEGLTNHVGQEISYAAHLNVFGPDVPLVDPRAHPRGLTAPEAVEFAHTHGGLVSLNHFFGVKNGMISHRFPKTREAFDESVSLLIDQRAYGVDLLEVGYRSRGHGLDAFLELWDRLALAGIRLTGIGTSDSHDEDVGWSTGPNNFITWIFAASDRQTDLMHGLRRGRAFFGDPTRFDGAMDIAGPMGSRMGDLVFVPRGRHPVRFDALGVRPGQAARWIRDGQAVETLPTHGEEFALEAEIVVDAPTFVRFELLEGGEPVALSNPLYLAPDDLPRPPPGARTLPSEPER